MFYWSIWSLVLLTPFLFGLWTDRGSLLYVAGIVFALMVVSCILAKGRPTGAVTLGKLLLFTLSNGVLVVVLGPWVPALVYAGILGVYFLRFSGILTNIGGVSYGAKGSLGEPAEPDKGVPGRYRFRDGIG